MFFVRIECSSFYVSNISKFRKLKPQIPPMTDTKIFQQIRHKKCSICGHLKYLKQPHCFECHTDPTCYCCGTIKTGVCAKLCDGCNHRHCSRCMRLKSGYITALFCRDCHVDFFVENQLKKRCYNCKKRMHTDTFIAQYGTCCTL